MSKSNSKYVKNHDIKRNAKRKEFKFYEDDVDDMIAYHAIVDAQKNHDGGAKGFIIQAIKNYLRNSL